MTGVTRKGDATNGHAWVPTVSDSSCSNTKANNIEIVRVGDHFTTHVLPYPPVAPHDSVGAQGSPNVFVEGKAAMRIGDTTSCSDTIAVGSANVIIN